MEEALALLLIAAARRAMNEAAYWAKDRSEEEIRARAAEEETRTKNLLTRMKQG